MTAVTQETDTGTHDPLGLLRQGYGRADWCVQPPFMLAESTGCCRAQCLGPASWSPAQQSDPAPGFFEGPCWVSQGTTGGMG